MANSAHRPLPTTTVAAALVLCGTLATPHIEFESAVTTCGTTLSRRVDLVVHLVDLVVDLVVHLINLVVDLVENNLGPVPALLKPGGI
jgi:hypothetical protein